MKKLKELYTSLVVVARQGNTDEYAYKQAVYRAQGNSRVG